MIHAQLLREYRLFCDDCTAPCDVKAVDAEEDANREARRKGWSVDQHSVLCPLCFQVKWRESRPTPTTLNDKELL